MRDLEEQYERAIRAYPNIIDNRLRTMSRGRLGEVNVCLEQECLPDGISRIDLAFITESSVFLVELKRDIVDADTLAQLRRYKGQFLKLYPRHDVIGFLVGMRCRDEKKLESAIGAEDIKILLFERDVPHPRKITECRHCGAGVRSDKDRCPCCHENIY
jgi:hypothetical protein